nr:unnamed protein product [Callosobruchus analis]
MEVNRLLGDELTYELQVRELPIGNTVAEKRMLFREALRMERQNLKTFPGKCTAPVELELDICSKKLSELRADVASFDSDNRENDFRRIYSRLLHVSERLARLQPNPDLEERKSLLYNESIQLLRELNIIFEQAKVSEEATMRPQSEQLQSREVSLIDAPNLLLPEVIHNNSQQGKEVSFDLVDVPPPNEALDEQLRNCSLLDDKQATETVYRRSAPPPDAYRRCEAQTTDRDRYSLPTSSLWKGNVAHPYPKYDDCNPIPFTHNTANFAPLTSSEQYPRCSQSDHLRRAYLIETFRTEGRFNEGTRFVDVGRWKVQFNGRSGVNEFLERVEELRISRGVSKEQLLRSAPELFTQDALLWYRTHNFTSWEALARQLKADFQPYDYEDLLWEEIRRRTQGAQERVVSFVAVMESMFRRLPSLPPEDKRVNMIRRNLLPSIQKDLALQTIHSISDLTRLARASEETDLRVRNFHPPPTNLRNLVEPEFAYRRVSSSSSQNVMAVSTNHTSTLPESLVNASEVRNLPTSNSQANSSNSRTPPTCWNCLQPNHKFRHCPEPRRVFCFKCGKSGVSSRTCPECSKNGLRGEP